MPHDRIETLKRTEPEYAVRLGDEGVFSVTPQAQSYFGFRPVDELRPEHIQPADREGLRQPYLHVVLAAPSELSEAPFEHEVAFYERRENECTVWATHPETPDQYVADGFSLVCDSYRKRYTRLRSATNEKIIAAEISKTRQRMFDAQYRTSQIADIVNCVKGTVFNGLVYLHEAGAAAADEGRQRILKYAGVRLQLREHSGRILGEALTTKPVIDKSAARAHNFSAAIFNIFSAENYEEYAAGGLTT